jgi:hypothetical protein
MGTEDYNSVKRDLREIFSDSQAYDYLVVIEEREEADADAEQVEQIELSSEIST